MVKVTDSKVNTSLLKPRAGFKFKENFTILRKIIVFNIYNNLNSVRNIALPVGFTLILIMASFSPTGVKDYKVNKIVIDPGHGGKDPGTHGEISREKDVALEISLKLGDIIKKYLPDVEVIYTRGGDSYPQLNERAKLANKNGADLFISVHCNWISNPRIRGTETYVMGIHKNEDNLNVARRENSFITQEENYKENYDGFDPDSPESYILFSLYQSAFQESSLKLANNIETQFRDRANRRSRGVKSAGFLVLYKTSMPSVLVETGFLSNQQEEKELNDELYQEYIASAIFRAVRDYKKDLETSY
jgi:N-acetylmuramoyl-L-alanine amidase